MELCRKRHPNDSSCRYCGPTKANSFGTVRDSPFEAAKQFLQARDQLDKPINADYAQVFIIPGNNQSIENFSKF